MISRTDGFTAGTPGRGGFSAASLQRGAHRASKAGSPLRVESDRGTPDRRLTGPAANHRRAESDTAERGSRRGSAGREIRSAPGIVWVALIAVLVAGPGCAAGADPAMAPDPAPGPARALEPALDATEPTEAEDDAGESADVEPVFTVADSRSAEPEFSNPDQAIAGEEVAEDEEQVDGEPARPRLTEDQRRELQLLLSVLRTNQLDAEQRRLAAETLLGRGWREAVEAMAADLRNGEPSTRRLIAEAVVRKSDPPAGLVDPLLAALQAESSDLREAVASALARYPADTVVPPLIERARSSDSPSPLRQGAIRALAEHRDPRAVETLIALLDGRRRESTRQAAFVALARLTGISGFGDDADAWRVWWNEVRDLPRDRWLGAIVRQLARRNAELEGRLASLANRLTDTVGRLYTATPEDQRPALLRQLLTDSMEQIRLLGLRLVERAMLNARSIPEELRDTLRQQLSADPKAELRAMAARLLRDVGDVPAAVRAADRFTEEPDPRVRDAYLALLARTVGAADEPSAAAIAEAIEPVLELLESDDLRQRAARFLAEAYDAGLLTADQAHRAIALARTEADSDDPLDPATVRLLSQLGNEEDWPRIVEALEHEDAQVRLAAAEAFVHGGMPLTPLLKWLKAPALRPVVLQAITRRGRTLETALALLAEEREAAEPQSAWESALLAMSERLAPPTLIELDNQLAGRPRLQPLRQSMLQRAADELIRNGGQPHEITDAELELVLRLARLYLETARPALARGYYERLANHVILEDEDRRQVRLGRLQATVASGQTDEARTLAAAMIDVDPGGDDAIVERMIQAAESALAAEQPGAAGRFVQLVRDVGIELDNEQASALDDLADRIAAARPPAPDETPTEEPDHEPPESEPTPAPDDAEA